MNALHFININMLYLLWLLPVLAGLFLHARRCRRRDLARFATNQRLKSSFQAVSQVRRFWKSILLLASVAFLVIGLARPAWNLKEITVSQAGRDVVYLLDVSRSMLAEDLAPNRLERAKLAIADSLEGLEGDRVALVAFAGNAVVKCPLTTDYGFFRLALEDISFDSVSRGGTLLGDAIRTVLDQVFDNKKNSFRDIVLITDGEDHESFPVEAAAAAGEQGIRLIIVGLGDENEGRRIPVTDEQGRKTFLKYQDREIWSKLDGDSLRKMAAATPGGRYLPVATGTVDLGQVYKQFIAAAEKQQRETRNIQRYEEKFQVFLAAAFLFLLLEALIAERSGRRGSIAG